MKVFSSSFQRQNLREEREWLGLEHSLRTFLPRTGKASHTAFGRCSNKLGSLATVNINLPVSNFQEIESNELCKIKTIEKQTHIPGPDASFTAVYFLSSEIDLTLIIICGLP